MGSIVRCETARAEWRQGSPREERANINYDLQCILYASTTVGYIHSQCVNVPEIRWNGFSGGGERILLRAMLSANAPCRAVACLESSNELRVSSNQTV